MKRGIWLLLFVVLLCSFLPQTKVFSQEESDFKNGDLLKYLQTLTPELVLEQANKDMKELYGFNNYYPSKTEWGSFNRNLVQKQINEAIKNSKKFTGFDIVYGSSHGDEITHHGQKMNRYAGYNVFGDPVSTDGFPWDAGWSGIQIHNLRLIPEPWNDKVKKNKFDNFPAFFKDQIPAKFKEYNPNLTFEGQILTALNRKYIEPVRVKYGDYLMHNNKDSEYKNFYVYTENGAPDGGWIKYVHVIQPPTYLSQGFGRVYMKSTYMDVPIAAFAATEGNDISAEFEGLKSSAAAGDKVSVSVLVDSSFSKAVNPTFSWTLTKVADDRSLTKEADQLQFIENAGGAAASGTIHIEPGGKRRLGVTFKMPDSAVRIQFKVNADGKSPKETYLGNNVLDSYPKAVKLAEPQSFPYDMLTKKVKITLPTNTVTLKLPDLLEAKWDGNATGSLNVYNRTETLIRDFKVHNNPPVDEDSESITRTPVVTYTIMRKDFSHNGKYDDPENSKYVNLDDPSQPLRRTGEIFYEGSVSRNYTYTEYVQKCTGSGEDEKCESVPETRHGTVTENFDSDTVVKPYEMYVYNGTEKLAPHKYRDEIDNNQSDSFRKNLFWTNEPYKFNVIRWMNHRDVENKEYNWTKVPGQYERVFTQQASGHVEWKKTSPMKTEYNQAREAAASKKNKKSLYDKAVFATDRELQKYDYPVKSGYYFNPAGSYTFTLNTVVFKDKKPGDMTADHKTLLDALIHSFRYESDLMYINNKKQAVNIHNDGLEPKSGGFKRKTGVLTVQNNKGVNGVKLIDVLDRTDDESRFAQHIEEIEHTDERDGESHVFWKKVMEGYSESFTETSHKSLKYREYVREEQHIYKITETSKITIVVNPDNVPLYTHANMPNGQYNIKVGFDNIDVAKLAGPNGQKFAYSEKLEELMGVKNLDSIRVTVTGSMFDDLNN